MRGWEGVIVSVSKPTLYKDILLEQTLETMVHPKVTSGSKFLQRLLNHTLWV